MTDTEQRFALSMRQADDDEPGLIRERDGTVWLVNPDGTRTQLPGGGNGGSLPEQWSVDETSGQFILNYIEDDIALQVNYAGDPTDYIPLLWLGDPFTQRDVLTIDSSGDADWHFRDAGVSLVFHVEHDLVNFDLLKISEDSILFRGLVGEDVLQYYPSDNIFTLGSAATTLGFFGAAGVTKRTGVAVDAAGIHAALVSYGLIAA